MIFRRSTRKKNIHDIKDKYRFPYREKKDKDGYKLELLIVVLIVCVLLI